MSPSWVHRVIGTKQSKVDCELIPNTRWKTLRIYKPEHIFPAWLVLKECKRFFKITRVPINFRNYVTSKLCYLFINDAFKIQNQIKGLLQCEVPVTKVGH